MALTDYKFVVVNGQNVKTFNETSHRWEQICLLSELTSDIITKKGFAYASLSTSYSTKLLPYSVSQTLDDGTVVYETEEITKSMGVTQFDEQTIGDTDYLVCTVPTFIPKDVMSSEDKLYAYSSTSGIYPAIISAEVNLPPHSHNGSTTNTTGQHQHGTPFNENIDWSRQHAPWGLYDNNVHYGSNGDIDWDNAWCNTSADGAHAHSISSTSSPNCKSTPLPNNPYGAVLAAWYRVS